MSRQRPQMHLMANERHQRHRHPPRLRDSAVKGAPVRLHWRHMNSVRAVRSQTARTARTLRWRAEQVMKGPQVIKTRWKQRKRIFFFIFISFYWIFTWFCAQISDLNLQAAVFNFDMKRRFWFISFQYSEYESTLSCSAPLSGNINGLRLETHTPAAPWAASSWIMLYWEAFTAVFFHNTRRHAALWELPVCDSNKRDELPPNHPSPNKWQFKCNTATLLLILWLNGLYNPSN